MLTEREKKILKLIVEKYIKEPVPVGSKILSKILMCSSATIRNDMMSLEDKGLLEKTHTSSGRVPSEEGYRYYVDYLMEESHMSSDDMNKLQIVFSNKQLALSNVIQESLQVISDMTNYTAIILGTSSHDNLLKQIEVVPIDSGNIVVIVVTDRGHVGHREVKLDNVSLDEVKKTVGLINNLIAGTPIDEVNKKLEFEIKPIISNYVEQHEKIYNAFYNIFTDFRDREVNVMGRTKFLEQPEFSSNIDKIKKIFTKLEDREVLKNIDEDSCGNIKVYIGSENDIDEEVTVIKTSFSNGIEEGTIAIVGPKRMEYNRVVSLLDFIKKNIER